MRPSLPGLSALPRYWKTVAVLVTMTALQALTAVLSIELLSSVRAYVTGESLYSKAQMSAQMDVLAYARSHDEADYQRFQKSLQVPLGDRLAREALQRSPPDLELARRGLIEGGNSPEDVDGAIRLFLWFHRVPFMAAPIATWTDADHIIERIRAMVEAARERILAGEIDSPEVVRMLFEAPSFNAELRKLENTFAWQLGEASRAVRRLVIALNLLIALVLTVTGFAFVRRTYRAEATSEAQTAASRAKTEFLSRMSHELRTPLNAVIGFVQLLRMDTANPLSQQQIDRLNHVEVAGEHLLALVNEVLDLSKIESGNLTLALEDIQISDVVDEAVNMVSPLVTKAGVEVFVSPFETGMAAVAYDSSNAVSVHPAPELWLRADRLRVRQILVNLISNAVKYNRPDGKVAITWKQMDGVCEIKVVDTGEGIPPERLDGLFEPFNRLGAERSRVEGTGIGLVLSRQLAEMMSGTLVIESQFAQGTTAVLRLQEGTAPADVQRREAPPAPSTVELQRINLLYAEDDEVNAEIIRQVFTARPSVALRVACNGAAAIEMAVLEPPDLMLVDMNLGDMTGIELARALRADRATRHVTLVALSADALPEQIDLALRSGFLRYLTKPIDFRALLATVDELTGAPSPDLSKVGVGASQPPKKSHGTQSQRI